MCDNKFKDLLQQVDEISEELNEKKQITEKKLNHFRGIDRDFDNDTGAGNEDHLDTPDPDNEGPWEQIIDLKHIQKDINERNNDLNSLTEKIKSSSTDPETLSSLEEELEALYQDVNDINDPESI